MRLSHAQVLSERFRQAVERLSEDDTLTDDTLHSNAEAHLEVLDDPSLGHLDTPAWVHRVGRYATQGTPQLTVTRLFNTMYQTADELGLASGKRYVSAAICTCASDTHGLRVGEPQAQSLAQRLSRLASAWIAFMLWPGECN
ncbi:uncharacterized protein C8Q71DRAFT_783597 [Rhodofomes roseus]|uniref:Uncharacterized protein n=1 Tax=Rhodofomes roseus TaxID=34475 RepID=A0ABQ8K2A4_9APHY|nr:uncharacterized protein C8Q71DRAFT_783597 [Rhodofomes roseus]KAH9830892.1 hypothetical protein C8Q71DRAFT_783597 [Rhodofomes roseus]